MFRKVERQFSDMANRISNSLIDRRKSLNSYYSTLAWTANYEKQRLNDSGNESGMLTNETWNKSVLDSSVCDEAQKQLLLKDTLLLQMHEDLYYLENRVRLLEHNNHFQKIYIFLLSAFMTLSFAELFIYLFSLKKC